LVDFNLISFTQVACQHPGLQVLYQIWYLFNNLRDKTIEKCLLAQQLLPVSPEDKIINFADFT
jgi:hypothetical protein